MSDLPDKFVEPSKSWTVIILRECETRKKSKKSDVSTMTRWEIVARAIKLDRRHAEKYFPENWFEIYDHGGPR